MHFYVLFCNHSDPVNQRMREAKRNKKKKKDIGVICVLLQRRMSGGTIFGEVIRPLQQW